MLHVKVRHCNRLSWQVGKALYVKLRDVLKEIVRNEMYRDSEGNQIESRFVRALEKDALNVWADVGSGQTLLVFVRKLNAKMVPHYIFISSNY